MGLGTPRATQAQLVGDKIRASVWGPATMEILLICGTGISHDPTKVLECVVVVVVYTAKWLKRFGFAFAVTGRVVNGQADVHLVEQNRIGVGPVDKGSVDLDFFA